MGYRLEQAFRQLRRHKGKALLTFLQLFISLLIIESVLAVYTSKQEEYARYLDSFGRDLYLLETSWISSGPPPTVLPPRLTADQVERLRSTAHGNYALYQTAVHPIVDIASERPIIVMEMDRPLYEEVVHGMGLSSVPAAL